MLITDSSVVFVKNVTLNGKCKIFVIIAGIIIILISITLAFIFGEKKEAIKEKVTQTIVEKTVESVVDKTANDVKEKAVEKITDLFNNK